VTGADTGVGKELAQILYSKHAKVYIAARSEEKALNAMESIKAAAPKATGAGELVFMRLDLADLTTIKASAGEFRSRETKLHVLFNNAGVMAPISGLPRTAQGYELHLGVNNIGTFMFTKLPTPILVATAKTEPPNTVRVVWVSSSAAEGISHRPGGVDMDNLNYHKSHSAIIRYATGKVGNYLHSTEYAKRYMADGIVSVSLNPGNLDSELYREQGELLSFILNYTLLHLSIFGAYTEMFAGLSSQVTLERSGEWSKPYSSIKRIMQFGLTIIQLLSGEDL
jgi:retinol dehydrogenase 12